MVKKSIIAIALIGMLASVSFAQDTQASGQFKVDGKWPVTCTYTPVEICKIPIVMEIGMFIEIDSCSKKKIVMKQITCEGNHAFPCYKGCTTIKVRCNFEAKLGLKLYKVGGIISKSGPNDNWTAYFRADSSDTTQSSSWIVAPDGNFHNVDVCVEAWDANIYGAPVTTDHTTFDNNGNVNHVGDEATVGSVAVTAIPTAVIVCN